MELIKKKLYPESTIVNNLKKLKIQIFQNYTILYYLDLYYHGIILKEIN
jgi:hypothetical protein